MAVDRAPTRRHCAVVRLTSCFFNVVRALSPAAIALRSIHPDAFDLRCVIEAVAYMNVTRRDIRAGALQPAEGSCIIDDGGPLVGLRLVGQPLSL